MKLYQHWEYTSKNTSGDWKGGTTVHITVKGNTPSSFLARIIGYVVYIRFFLYLKKVTVYYTSMGGMFLHCDNDDLYTDVVGFLSKHFPRLEYRTRRPARLFMVDSGVVEIVNFHHNVRRLLHNFVKESIVNSSSIFLHDSRTVIQLECSYYEKYIDSMEKYKIYECPMACRRVYEITEDLTTAVEELRNNSISFRIGIIFNANLTSEEALSTIEGML